MKERDMKKEKDLMPRAVRGAVVGVKEEKGTWPLLEYDGRRKNKSFLFKPGAGLRLEGISVDAAPRGLIPPPFVER